VAYVHGGTYEETSTAQAARAGVDAWGDPSPIYVIAAPVNGGFEKVRIKRAMSSNGTTFNGPLLRLGQPYWALQWLQISATTRPDPLCSQPSCDLEDPAVSVEGHHIALYRIIVSGGPARQAVLFNNASDAALMYSTVVDNPKGVYPGRSDWHGVQVFGASQRLLFVGNYSGGHHGDSLQCNFEYTAPAYPSHITIEGNIYHDDLENAVDIKRCERITVRDNTLYGYDGTATAPGGDAVVAHYGADRVLIQGNQISNSGRGINIGPGRQTVATPPGYIDYEVGIAVVRRNRIYDACTIPGCLGAGIRVAAKRADVYHNTLDNLPGEPGNPNASAGAALRIGNPPANPTDGKYDRAVVRNNVISRAAVAGRAELRNPADPADTGVAVLDTDYNLYLASPTPTTPWPNEPHSRTQSGPLLSPPDFRPVSGSDALDTAEPLGDPWKQPIICGAGPDIGAQEACP
jgi:hypothetical protein